MFSSVCICFYLVYSVFFYNVFRRRSRTGSRLPPAPATKTIPAWTRSPTEGALGAALRARARSRPRLPSSARISASQVSPLGEPMGPTIRRQAAPDADTLSATPAACEAYIGGARRGGESEWVHIRRGPHSTSEGVHIGTSPSLLLPGNQSQARRTLRPFSFLLLSRARVGSTQSSDRFLRRETRFVIENTNSVSSRVPTASAGVKRADTICSPSPGTVRRSSSSRPGSCPSQPAH
eukprot:1184503-Prorocentrum_minimum.AAC.3